MGSISVACYRPKSGREQALLELVRNHLPPLPAEGLVTARAPIVMRHRAEGAIVEIFEWASQETIMSAHKNPVCSYETPSNIPEFQSMFGHSSQSDQTLTRSLLATPAKSSKCLP